MPNRIIKESICRSSEIDNLSWFEEVLFYRLIVNCDDYGRFDGREKIIKSICFPLKEIKDGELQKGLNSLVSQGLIIKYEVGGKQVIQLTTWEQHQQIRSKRSKYPGMDEDGAHVISDDSKCNQMISKDSKCPRNPIQSESESESESKPTQAALVGESNLSDPVKEKLLEWLKYKKERREGYKETGLRTLISEVGRHEQESGSTAVINLINQSMSSGWKGIIWDRLPTARSGTSELDAWANA